MPTPTPQKASTFNAQYPIIGKYRTDDDRIPYFNPEDSGVSVLPGEPMLIEQGDKDDGPMAQGPIEPGQTGYLVRRFTGDFPCILSADVEQGTEIWWDTDVGSTDHPVGVARLKGDVTNGFMIGVASYAYDGHKNPTLGINDRVLCGGIGSTHIRVVSLDGIADQKGNPYTPPTTTTSTSTTTT